MTKPTSQHVQNMKDLFDYLREYVIELSGAAGENGSDRDQALRRRFDALRDHVVAVHESELQKALTIREHGTKSVVLEWLTRAYYKTPAGHAPCDCGPAIRDLLDEAGVNPSESAWLEATNRAMRLEREVARLRERIRWAVFAIGFAAFLAAFYAIGLYMRSQGWAR